MVVTFWMHFTKWHRWMIFHYATYTVVHYSCNARNLPQYHKCASYYIFTVTTLYMFITDIFTLYSNLTFSQDQKENCPLVESKCSNRKIKKTNQPHQMTWKLNLIAFKNNSSLFNNLHRIWDDAPICLKVYVSV